MIFGALYVRILHIDFSTTLFTPRGQPSNASFALLYSDQLTKVLRHCVQHLVLLIAHRPNANLLDFGTLHHNRMLGVAPRRIRGMELHALKEVHAANHLLVD